MARNIVSASSQYLIYLGAPVTAAPFSVSVWFNPSSVTTYWPIFSITNAADSNYWLLQSRGDMANDPLELQIAQAGSGLEFYTSTSVLANVWQHALGVSGSTTDHRVYLNGGGLGSSATSKAPAGLFRTAIGAYYGSSANYFNGPIAHVAIWDAALTAAEALILSKGFSPLFVRPQNLVAYWPLMGVSSPEPDIVSGFAMGLVNAPAATDNPRIFYPAPPAFTRLTEAVNSGVLTQTFGALTVVAAGTVQDVNIDGILAQTLGAVTISAAGTVATAGGGGGAGLTGITDITAIV